MINNEITEKELKELKKRNHKDNELYYKKYISSKKNLKYNKKNYSFEFYDVAYNKEVDNLKSEIWSNMGRVLPSRISSLNCSLSKKWRLYFVECFYSYLRIDVPSSPFLSEKMKRENSKEKEGALNKIIKKRLVDRLNNGEMSFSTYKPIKYDDMKAVSCDKIALLFDSKLSTIDEILNNSEMFHALKMFDGFADVNGRGYVLDFWENKGKGVGYKYVFMFKTFREVYDNNGDILGRVYLNNLRFECFLIQKDYGSNINRSINCRVEFNPNKIEFENPVFDVLRSLINVRSLRISSLDVAFDCFDFGIDNVIFDKMRKREKMKYNVIDNDKAGKTVYLGKKPTQIKIYEKMSEIKYNNQFYYYGDVPLIMSEGLSLDDWVRIEEGFSFNELYYRYYKQDNNEVIKQLPKSERVFDIACDDYLAICEKLNVPTDYICLIKCIMEGFATVKDIYPRAYEGRGKKLREYLELVKNCSSSEKSSLQYTPSDVVCLVLNDVFNRLKLD